MRSLRTDSRLLVLALLSLVAGAACIIGPKQDDPESATIGTPDAGAADPETGPMDGTDAAADSSFGEDARPLDGAPPAADTGPREDGCGPGDADASDACGDAGNDAVRDAADDAASDAADGG